MNVTELNDKENKGELKGIFDLSEETYHSPQCPGWNSSVLKDFIRYSPKKAMYMRSEKKESDALTVGSALHCAVLQKDKFDDMFIVAPEGMRRDPRTAAYKDFLFSAGNKKVLSQEEMRLVDSMAGTIGSNAAAQDLLKDGTYEKAIFWKDSDTGLTLKCKPDAISADGLLVDIKTCQSANPYVFGRACIDYGYDLSAAMYVDGLNANGISVSTMYFICIEKSAPYEIAIYHFSDQDIELGRAKYKKAAGIISKCMESGVFPGYPEESRAIVLPTWAYSFDGV